MIREENIDGVIFQEQITYRVLSADDRGRVLLATSDADLFEKLKSEHRAKSEEKTITTNIH